MVRATQLQQPIFIPTFSSAFFFSLVTDLFGGFMYMICTKVEFSNSQSNCNWNHVISSDEELFILAFFKDLLQQPISLPTFSSALFIIITFL